VSSEIWNEVLSNGTLKSTRTSARFPVKSKVLIDAIMDKEYISKGRFFKEMNFLMINKINLLRMRRIKIQGRI
jgi:hypothetical protein